MKKMVIMLIVFVLSVSAFAQDEEPLTVSPAGRVIDISLAPDESTFMTVSASVDRDGNVTNTVLQQWDTLTGEELIQVAPSFNALYTRYSSDGTLIGVGYTNGSISIHDAATLDETIMIPNAFGGDGTIFHFSADNSILVGEKSDAVVSNVEDGALITLVEGVDGESITNIIVSPDGTQLITSDFGRNLNLHDALTGEIIETLAPLEGAAEYLFWVDDTHILLGGRQSIDLMDIETLEVIHSFGVEGTTMIYASLYETRLAASTFGGQAVIWDLETGELVETVLDGLYRGPQDMALGASVLVGSSDAGVSVWALANPLLMEEDTEE